MKNFFLAALICTLVPFSAAHAQSAAPVREGVPLFVGVRLDPSVKLSALKAGDSVEGNLTRDVYSPGSRVYASGSHIRLTVSRVERKRKTPSEKWPWVAKLFLPHHENFPIFNSAAISMPDGTQSAIEASWLSSNRMKEVKFASSHESGKKLEGTAAVTANPNEKESEKSPSAVRGPVLYLEAYRTSGEISEGAGWIHSGPATSSVVPAGTACRVLLLDDVSASKSHVGDTIRARVLEPILADSQVVIPAGSMFVGRVLKATPPRIPSRAGTLTIAFESLQLPEGQRIAVSGSLASVDVNASSPMKMDREGRLHGSRPGVLWAVINGGVAGGIAKEVDDGTQLLLEAIVSTATDASTAGTARIAGTVASTIYMLTRKGHDVVLPNHTEMAVTLNRPLTFSAQVATIPLALKDDKGRN